MDPLSVSASVVGLVTAAAQITSILCDFTGNVKDAPILAHHVMSEIYSINAAICSLQMFLVGEKRTAKSRESMILVEHLVVTLTGCVCTFSELEREVNSLKSGPDMKAMDKLKWALKEDTITQIFQRLQNHKSSLTLMLSILESKSVREAEKSTKKLCGLVTQLLESQKDISDRLKRLEATPAQSLLRVDSSARSVHTLGSRDSKSLGKSKSIRESIRQSIRYSTSENRAFVFDTDLTVSRVYKRALNHNPYNLAPTFLNTSTNQSTYSSSQLNLADISNISFLSLPIFPLEISNSQWYDFGTARDEDSVADSGDTITDIHRSRLGFEQEKDNSHIAVLRTPLPISASVGSCSTSNGLRYYEVNVVMEDGRNLYLRRFYQDFYELHIELIGIFPAYTWADHDEKLPKLPGPMVWLPGLGTHSTLTDDPTQLQQQLDVYIKELLMLPEVIKSLPVKIFFSPRHDSHLRDSTLSERHNQPQHESGIQLPDTSPDTIVGEPGGFMDPTPFSEPQSSTTSHRERSPSTPRTTPSASPDRNKFPLPDSPKGVDNSSGESSPTTSERNIDGNEILCFGFPAPPGLRTSAIGVAL